MKVRQWWKAQRSFLFNALVQLRGRLSSLAFRGSKIYNQGNDTQRLLMQQFAVLASNLRATHNRYVSLQLNSRLLSFEMSSREKYHRTPVGRPLPEARSLDNFDASLESLQAKFPVLYPVWRKLLENGEHSYISEPKTSLSIAGNPLAVLFRAFCLPFLNGAVLDIGCGPTWIPIYLQGYDVKSIAAIDPFGSQNDHPFRFVRAVAEFLPWEDRAFNTVVVATSLDHLLDLEQGVSEIFRVLDEDGECLLWMWFQPGAPKFDPRSPTAGPIDSFHLFHFDRPWFLSLMEPYADVLEEIDVDGSSYFYRMRKRDHLTPQ